MEELRVKLKCKTSHILVGGANDELVMNHSTKMKEAVTQKLVDRCVLVGANLSNKYLTIIILNI